MRAVHFNLDGAKAADSLDRFFPFINRADIGQRRAGMQRSSEV